MLLGNVEGVNMRATSGAVLRLFRALRSRPQPVETEATEELRVAVVCRVTRDVIVDVTSVVIKHDAAT